MKTLKNIILLTAACAAVSCATRQQPAAATGEPSLKAAYGDKFLVGTALNTPQITGMDHKGIEVVKQHFNAIVPENCMKCEIIHPEEHRYDFSLADRLVDFGEQNGITVTGHCLIWHSQMAPWFCVDDNGKLVSPEVLKQRMKDHIYTVVGRYKGRIKGWDVVNEAILEGGVYRRSPLYEILGEEFIPLAFQYAHEADPDVELYYNDYGMTDPGRRDAVIALVHQLKERGLRIDGVGMQGHIGMDYPTVEEFEQSIVMFGEAGVNVMITEWDMSALPTISRSANISDIVEYRKAQNPYPDGLPEDISAAWNARMKEFFNIFVKHSDVVSRVTAWGVADSDSWKNGFPVHGRVDYALLFDRNHQPKPFVTELISEAEAER